MVQIIGGTLHQWQSNGLSLSIFILFLQQYPFHNPDRERQYAASAPLRLTTMLSSRAESISISLSFSRPIPIAISSLAVCSSALFDEKPYIYIRTRGA